MWSGLRAGSDSTCNAVFQTRAVLDSSVSQLSDNTSTASGIIRERCKMWKRRWSRIGSHVPEDEKSCHEDWTVTPWPLSLQELVKVLRRFLNHTPPSLRQCLLRTRGGNAKAFSTAIASTHGKGWRIAQDCTLTAVFEKEHLKKTIKPKPKTDRELGHDSFVQSRRL